MVEDDVVQSGRNKVVLGQLLIIVSLLAFIYLLSACLRCTIMAAEIRCDAGFMEVVSKAH